MTTKLPEPAYHYQPVLDIDEPRRLLFFLTAVAATLVGAIAATGNFSVIAALLGAILSSVFLPSRRALLIVSIIGGIVIAGTAQLYIPGTRMIRYVIPLVTLVLFSYAAIDSLLRTPGKRKPYSKISLAALSFALFTLVSSGLNWPGVTTAMDNSKAYFQMWLLLPCFTMLAWEEKFIDSLLKLAVVVALIQIPLVLQQYLVLVPMRQWLGDGVVAADILVGTFGGEKLGGGANSVLSVFLLTVSVCLMAAWRRKAISGWLALTLCPLFLLPSFFNQAKVVVLYIPILLGVVFYRDFIARPGRFLIMLGACCLLLTLLLTALINTDMSGKTHSVTDLINGVVARQTTSIDERTGPYARLTRVTALSFWAEQHKSENITYTMFGHGPGASRVQSKGFEFSKSLAESRYDGLPIGVTAASALLWDTGAIGLMLVLMIFYRCFRSCRLLAKHYDQDGNNFKAAIFEGLSAAIIMLAISLAHKDYFVFNLPYQTLLISIFGYIAYHEKHHLCPIAGKS